MFTMYNSFIFLCLCVINANGSFDPENVSNLVFVLFLFFSVNLLQGNGCSQYYEGSICTYHYSIVNNCLKLVQLLFWQCCLLWLV